MNNPLKERPLRLPGQSLDDKINDIFDEKILSYLALIIIVVILIIYEWIRWYWLIPPQPIAMTVSGIIAIIFSEYKIRKFTFEIRAIRQGRDGERIVGQHLEELRANGCTIFHDVQGLNFNIDHVVVAPQGIFTIETKTWSKRDKNEKITFNGNDLIVNGHKPDRDAIAQSKAEANSLRKILKDSTGKEFQVKPVIVFPGWFVDPEGSKRAQEKGVWLLNPKAFPSYIKNAPIILSGEDLNMISHHLIGHIQMTIRQLEK